MTTSTRALLLVGVLVLVGFTSQFARRVAHDKLAVEGISGWVTTDPDSLYHVRRVARLLDEGPPVAGRDAYLNYPDGARIPWPPYYTLLVAGLLPTDLPSEPAARRAAIEQGVASVPLLFGVGASLLAAALAFLIGGPAAGLFAGLYHALCIGSIAYSRVGNGDHHAFVSMLLALELLLFSLAARAGFRSRTSATLLGILAGALAGVMLGAWVGALIYILALQLVLGWFLFARAREPHPGLAVFGLGFHLSALVCVLPAISASPWKDEFPWMVVNLSWFHAAHLFLGAVVFVPALLSRADSERARRRYPLIVTLAVALLAALVLAIDAGPGRGVREGFEWVSRADQFMSGIQESRPLLAPGTFDGAQIRRMLGDAVALLPLAWVLAAITVLRRGERVLVPLVLVTPLLAAQAGAQARFADALSVSMAVLIAWGLARVTRWIRTRCADPRWARGPTGLAGALLLAVLAAGLSQRASLVPIWKQWGASRFAPRQTPRRAAALRGMLEWMRVETPDDGDACVLANWSQGHAIEWGANRPSVATNFGSYVGFDSYADPGRFFLCEDEAQAEALLAERRARYVLITSSWPNALPEMIQAACPERAGRYLEHGGERSGRLRPEWFRTIGARLLFEGGSHPAAGLEPDRRLDFVRLVHASPGQDRRPMLASHGVERSPYGWLWEHVRGARLQARADPGTELRIELEVEYGLAELRFRYVGRATADASGRASLRVPYCTLGRNGDGWVTGEPSWTLGERSGRLAISEQDVLSGATLQIPPPE